MGEVSGAPAGTSRPSARNARIGVQGLVLQMRERRHASAALAHALRELFWRHAAGDADQRRKLRRRALAVVAVAGGAVAQVDGFAGAAPGVVERQRAEPRHLVGVHVEQAARGVERRSAPFGAAVETGVDSRVDAHAERLERPVAAQLRELLARPAVGLRRARGEGVRGQPLPRVGRGQPRAADRSGW